MESWELEAPVKGLYRKASTNVTTNGRISEKFGNNADGETGSCHVLVNESEAEVLKSDTLRGWKKKVELG